jgi:hypothetical protein
MQIVINIEKKHLYAFVLLIGLFGSFAYAYNSGGTGGNPSVMGHSFDETGTGVANVYAGGVGNNKGFKILRESNDYSGGQVNPTLLSVVDSGWLDNPANRMNTDYALYVSGISRFNGQVRVPLGTNAADDTPTELIICNDYGMGYTCVEDIENVGTSNPLCVSGTGRIGLC